MLLFLSRKESYVILDSVENTRNEVMAILNRPWHDLSAEMKGQYSQEDRFVISPGFSLAISGNLVMEGRLSSCNGYSQIDIKVRPKPGILLLIAVLLFWLLFEISRLEAPLSNNKLLPVTLLKLVVLFFCFSLYRSAKSFSKRFERIMNIS
jgi:hypothetical protein